MVRAASVLVGFGLLVTIGCGSELREAWGPSGAAGVGGDAQEAGTEAGGAAQDAGLEGGSGGASGGLQATQANGRYFPSVAAWYQDESAAAVASDSATITQWMVQHAPPSGWGTSQMSIDFSIPVVEVPAGTSKRAFQTVDGYFYTPDCDTAPVPVPQGGMVEQPYGVSADLNGPWTGYNCSNFDQGPDCHMLLLARSEGRLYEIYHATIDSNATFRGGCLAVWDLSHYNVQGRGEQCTSADAAGFPIAPLLFTAEEIQAGVIEHAIRFILPNDMIRAKKYVSPGTHGTQTTGPVTAIPYAGRMRLKSSFDLNQLSPAAKIVARALQKYGMLLADGGQVTLTAQSDALSTVKWAEVGLQADALGVLKATDFDVIEYGTPIDVTNNCQRQPITQ